MNVNVPDTDPVSRLPDQRLIALHADGGVLGWAAASPVSARAVYAGVVEHSVYVAPAGHGRGVGRLLLDALIGPPSPPASGRCSPASFPRTFQASVCMRPPGFREVGIRKRIARMAYGPMTGLWRDTVLLERRSFTAGG